MKINFHRGTTLVPILLCGIMLVLTSVAAEQFNWSTVQHLTNDGATLADSSVHMEADHHGTIVAAWTVESSEGVIAIKVARSLNHGATFEASTQLSPFLGKPGYPAFPQVVNNGGGKWSVFYVSDRQKFVSRSLNNGETWSAPQQTAPHGEHFEHRIGSNQAGVLHALLPKPYPDENSNEFGTVILQSTNGGESFTTTTILPMPYMHSIIYTGGTNWLAQHHDGTVRLSSNNGQTWTVAHGAHGLDPNNPFKLVSDGKGTVVAAETVSASDSNYTLTHFVSASHDGGDTWTSKTQVHTRSEPATEIPTVSTYAGTVTPLYLRNGQWALAMTYNLSFYSLIYFNTILQSSEVFLSISADGGLTWSTAVETAPDADPLTSPYVQFFTSRNYLIGSWWEIDLYPHPSPDGDLLYKRAFIPPAGPTAAADWQLFN